VENEPEVFNFFLSFQKKLEEQLRALTGKNVSFREPIDGNQHQRVSLILKR
jgi:hypothetical protein